MPVPDVGEKGALLSAECWRCGRALTGIYRAGEAGGWEGIAAAGERLGQAAAAGSVSAAGGWSLLIARTRGVASSCVFVPFPR